jgi:hypothetical protein
VPAAAVAATALTPNSTNNEGSLTSPQA